MQHDEEEKMTDKFKIDNKPLFDIDKSQKAQEILDNKSHQEFEREHLKKQITILNNQVIFNRFIALGTLSIALANGYQLLNNMDINPNSFLDGIKNLSLVSFIIVTILIILIVIYETFFASGKYYWRKLMSRRPPI